MTFLLDTNCWMQIARCREHAEEVRRLLTEVPSHQIVLTDFAVHSIALALRRHRTLDSLTAFIEQAGIGRSIAVVRLAPTELELVVRVCKTWNLDFDDAYQYVAAELHGLRLVSLDADFDRTPNGRITPEAALRQFTDEQQQRPQQEP